MPCDEPTEILYNNINADGTVDLGILNIDW
jgi:hypothetical protein